MIKLLLAIAGLYRITYKLGTQRIDAGFTRADILKESYYEHADRNKCLCGGDLIRFRKFPRNSLSMDYDVKKCNSCEKEYPIK